MVTRDFEITLRIPETTHIPTMFQVTQNDKDVYGLTVHITNGITEIDYTEVEEATITFSKADGNVVQGDMTVGADSLTYTMGTNEISYPGQVLASIQLFGASGERLTTARFRFNVVADLITEDAVKSTSEFAILQQLKQELEDIDVVDLTNQFNAHKAESVSHLISLARDASLVGTQTISVPFKTKSVSVIAIKQRAVSIGFWSPNGQRCLSQRNDGIGNHIGSANLIALYDNADNRTSGNIANVTSTSFDIIWTTMGTPTSNQMLVYILATGHGE